MISLNFARLIVLPAIAATAVSACRIGNNSEPGTPTASAARAPTLSDWNGYYSAEPKGLQFCAFHSETRCVEVTLDQIPEEITAIMSNPVAFAVQDESTGDAAIYNPDDTRSWVPIVIEDEGVLTGFYSYKPLEAWDSDECMQSQYLIEGGQLTKNPSGELSGSLALIIRMYTQFGDGEDATPVEQEEETTEETGTDTEAGTETETDTETATETETEPTEPDECDSSMSALYACYTDLNLCGERTDEANESKQAIIQAIFEPYIRFGVMTPEDIPNLQGFLFDVTYK